MTVKIFVFTILLLVTVTATGLATWLFPIVNNIHTQLGGQALEDPRGTWLDQVNIWLSFLPSNNIERAQIVCYIVAAYLVVTSTITLIAVRLHKRRAVSAAQRVARDKTMRLVSRPAPPPKWRRSPIANEYTVDEPGGVTDG